jgi:hypothetical protein
LPLQTFLVVILFVVGGLQWSGATTGNVAAGTALVRVLVEARRMIVLTTPACNLLLLDLLFPGHRDVSIRLLR